jgi:hypothetical protein
MEERSNTMIFSRSIFIILLTIILIGCSKQPQHEEVSRAGDNISTSKSLSDKTRVIISPVNATAQTTISLQPDSTLIGEEEINWYINGEQDVNSKGLRFAPNQLKKGDVVQAVIVQDNKDYHSNEITIKNTPPVITRSALLPSIPRVSSTLLVEINAYDIDKDNISFQYKWTLNGRFISDQSFLEKDLKRGDMIMVEVTPFDGENKGRSIRIKSKVYNSLPVISESKPSFDGKIYQYHFNASDPDGDLLTYTLRQGPEGMTIDSSTGIITWEVTPDKKVVHDIKVSVSDNHGGELLVPFTTKISYAKKQ